MSALSRLDSTMSTLTPVPISRQALFEIEVFLYSLSKEFVAVFESVFYTDRDQTP